MPNPSNINCDSFELRIQDVMDARLDPSRQPELTGHADQCCGCRPILDRYSQLHTILNCAFTSDGSPGFASRSPISAVTKDNSHEMVGNLIANAGSDSLDSPGRKRRRQVSSLDVSTAAMVLLAVGLTVVMLQSGGGIPIARSKTSSFVVATSSGSEYQLQNESVNGLASSPIRQVSSFRSIETCYEITAELPGIRPLQSSLSVAIDWLQKSIGGNWFSEQKPDDSNSNFGALHHELAFRTA